MIDIIIQEKKFKNNNFKHMIKRLKNTCKKIKLTYISKWKEYLFNISCSYFCKAHDLNDSKKTKEFG